MKTLRDVLLSLVLLLAVAAGAAGGAPASSFTLDGVRLGVTPERTRVVLELDRAGVRFETAIEDSVIRVRLASTRRSSDLRLPAADGPLLRSLQVDAAGGVCEVLLLLRRAVEPKVFPVEAGDGRPPRLVIDLPGGEETSPGRAASPDASAATGPPATPALVAPVDPTPVPAGQGPHVVVIDAGHGGDDPGAVRAGLQEKTVCLDVARRLADLLNRTPGFRAHLTRSDDRRITLGERMRVAERHDADLFVSIHVNAAKSTKASGAEVFFLSIGAATDRAASELARLENEADPDLVVAEDQALIELPFGVNLRQSDTLLRSSRIAEVVLDVLSDRKLAEPRGVKQAGFAVLKSFQVPSILVELGFISSQADRKKLQTAGHRAQLAEALNEGIQQYFERFAPKRSLSDGPGTAR